MAHDENFTRFFCFLSLFAAAMLGVVIANSLLLLFICWELVGLTSYLLIGFWYHKPSAAAAAKKAFITTRIGDLAFLLAVQAEWSRTDADYQTRIAHLNGSLAGGLNGASVLDGQSVVDDGAVDVLASAAARPDSPDGAIRKRRHVEQVVSVRNPVRSADR